MRNYDAAVIGGGISGLLAAIEVAKAGKKVILLEKSSNVGGRGISVRKNGALLNLGGHAIYRGGAAYAALQRFGVELEGGIPSTSGSIIWKNELIPLPSDPLKLLTSKLFSFSGKMELGRLLMRLGKINAAELADVSLREWAEQEIVDPMVRHLFYTLCRTSTYSRDLDYQTAATVLHQVHLSIKSGVLYLDGGWQSIVDQLQKIATNCGVTIQMGASVSAIKHSGGAVQGVHLGSGELLEVERVISTLSPSDNFRLVPGAEQTILRHWKEDSRPITAACLDLALKRLPVVGRDFVMGIDQPIFFSNHSRAAKLSDNGTIIVHMIKYNAVGEHDPKADEQLLTDMMNLLHPGWQQEVTAKQFLPSITVVHDYPHKSRRDHKPGPAVPEIRGLYVAGDWASHGEMLLDAVAASAGRAASMLIQEAEETRDVINV
ncbi:phytoene desaturase family protein [Paenibacillus sp. UNC451MF]|uniref:phytoene desaturase family protein n=1 Tax=Paenibacillus sp. UNC451MF TaxID=1449063 RepID=UPI00048AA55F|nr:FAD-dependent oxidoreductase [Paenibacillus sp. UNC451MF]